MVLQILGKSYYIPHEFPFRRKKTISVLLIIQEIFPKMTHRSDYRCGLIGTNYSEAVIPFLLYIIFQWTDPKANVILYLFTFRLWIHVGWHMYICSWCFWVCGVCVLTDCITIYQNYTTYLWRANGLLITLSALDADILPLGLILHYS